jgi:hypothetical protein
MPGLSRADADGLLCRMPLWDGSKQRQERATPANTGFDLLRLLLGVSVDPAPRSPRECAPPRNPAGCL